MMKKKLSIGILIATTLILNACSAPAPQYAPAPQAAQAAEQMIGQEAPQQGVNPLLAAGAGAAAGYLLGKHNGKKQMMQAAPPQVIHVYHRQAPRYRSYRSYRSSRR